MASDSKHTDPCPIKKKRGRPKKGTIAPVVVKERKNISWTIDMEDKLLELRYDVLYEHFCAARNKTDVCSSWNKIVMDLLCFAFVLRDVIQKY